MDFNKRIAELEQQMTDLVKRSEASEDVNELRSINHDIENCRAQIETLKQAKAAVDEAVDERTKAVNDAAEQREAKVPEGALNTEKRDEKKPADDLEERGANLKQRGKSVRFASNILFNEKRSVTTTTPTIVVPTFTSSTINDGFNTVSGLIDRVKHVPLNGGESYEEPYRIDIPEGVYTAEGVAASDTDVTFDKAAMTKAKITAYSEISREMLRLPNADYAGYVQNAIRESIRAKMAHEILVGAGTTNSFVGIFSTKATAIDSTTDLTLDGINDETLDQIVFNYGGKEDVEDAAVLILNKLDLLAFAAVRTSTKQKFYDIQSHGNYGTINGIPYIINSACSQLTDTTKKTADYCMAYGSLSSYTIATFADIEVAQSDQYKFKEGMISNRGDVYAAGNVTRYNGFLRIKRKATT